MAAATSSTTTNMAEKQRDAPGILIPTAISATALPRAPPQSYQPDEKDKEKERDGEEVRRHSLGFGSDEKHDFSSSSSHHQPARTNTGVSTRPLLPVGGVSPTRSRGSGVGFAASPIAVVGGAGGGPVEDPVWEAPRARNQLEGIPLTLKERLDPTLEVAREELGRYTKVASWSSIALNGAIGLQVLLGALITGISAAASPKGAQISTSLLGGASTVVASYLARARGSGEPEISKQRMRDLSKFIRQCEALILDYGNERPSHSDPNPSELHQRLLKDIDAYRTEFDNLISTWNGEKNPGGSPRHPV